MRLKLGVLGCGKMGSALLTGMRSKLSEFEIYTFDPMRERSLSLAEAVNGKSCASIKGMPDCQYYLLACKPQNFKDLSSLLGPKVESSNNLMISILAGTSVSTIQKSLNVERVVRIMPNTPSIIGEGVSAVYFTENVSNEEKGQIVELLEETSNVYIFEDEKFIDIVTGFSGSGPAYIFQLAHLLIEKLVSMGVESSQAESLIKQTIYGASKLMVDSEKNPFQLREEVTSKKGVTEEALNVFREKELDEIVSLAMDRAYQRAMELSKN